MLLETDFLVLVSGHFWSYGPPVVLN